MGPRGSIDIGLASVSGLRATRGTGWLRDCWQDGGAERRVWIVTGVFFAAWATWGLVWWLG